MVEHIDPRLDGLVYGHETRLEQNKASDHAQVLDVDRRRE
jgi:hypothetical protein